LLKIGNITQSPVVTANSANKLREDKERGKKDEKENKNYLTTKQVTMGGKKQASINK